MAKARTDVAVIGGGIIGLSAAWQLAVAGLEVTLIERDQPGCGATVAAAGMLAPLAEASEEGAFARMGLESLAMYAAFLEALRGDSSSEVGLSSHGMMRLAFDDEECARLRASTEWQRQFGLTLEVLTQREACSAEPALSPDVKLAVHSPEERCVDPRAMTRALSAACRKRNVRFINAEAKIEDGSVVWGSNSLTASAIVIAAGAWSGGVEPALPLVPVRGQILTATAAVQPVITLFSHRGYIVPRDGMMLVGATEERVGFDCGTTDEGISELSGKGARLLAAGEIVVKEAHAGLRPGTPDRMPIIGRLSDQRLIAATGHYRNGILLAPLTAKIVTGLVTAGEEHPLSAFVSPARFAGATV